MIIGKGGRPLCDKRLAILLALIERPMTARELMNELQLSRHDTALRIG